MADDRIPIRNPEIPELKTDKYDRYLPSSFDESNTIIEKINNLLEFLRLLSNDYEETVENLDEIREDQYERIEDLYDDFNRLKVWLEGKEEHLRDDFESLKSWTEGAGLRLQTKHILEKWYDNGDLTEIIQDEVFDGKADKDYLDRKLRDVNQTINKNTEDIEKLDDDKASKNSVNEKANKRYVDREIDNVDKKISDIVASSNEDISNEEIVDARRGEDSLGDKIRLIDDNNKPFYRDLTSDPFFNRTNTKLRFSNVRDFEYVDNGVDFFGSGSHTNPALRRTIIKKDDYKENMMQTLYLKARLKVEKEINYIKLAFNDGITKTISSSKFKYIPVNKWVDLSYMWTPTGNYQFDGDVVAEVAVYYKSKSEAEDAKTTINHYINMDVTEEFGEGNEPSKETLDDIFRNVDASTIKNDEFNAIDYLRSMTLNQEKDKPPYVFGELTEYYESPSFDSMTEEDDDPLVDYKTEDFHSLYEDLYDKYPNRIDRYFLGYATNSSGEDDEDRSIYEYVFRPPYTSGNIRGTDFTDPVKVLITTGIHGNEKSTIFTTYKMFEKMMEDEFTKLTPLRLNVEFRIIPVGNPYGVDKNTRNNAEGQNVNRDFLDDNKGNEINIIREWVYDNTDAILILDNHNTWMDSNGLTYGISNIKAMRDIFIGVSRTLIFDWNNKYDGYADNQTEGYTMTGGNGHVYYETLQTTDIPYGVLLETATDDHDRVEYTSEVLERNYGLTTNFLRAFFDWLNKQ